MLRLNKTKIAALVLLFTIVIGGSFLARRQTEKQLQANIETNISLTLKRMEELTKITAEEKALREQEREIFDTTVATEDVKIDGVQITLFQQTKKIKNVKENYSIEVPLHLIIARSVASDRIEFHDKRFFCVEDPSCSPIISIRVTDENPEKLLLEQWLAREEQNAGEKIYSPREKITVGGKTGYKITVSIPRVFEGFYYYFSQDQKIYSLRISKFDEPAYKSALESFSFF